MDETDCDQAGAEAGNGAWKYKHDRNSGDGKRQYGNAEGCGRNGRRNCRKDNAAACTGRGVIYFCWCGLSWKGRRQSAGKQTECRNAIWNGHGRSAECKKTGRSRYGTRRSREDGAPEYLTYAFGAIPENELLRIKGHSKIKCAVKWAKKGKSAVEIASMYGILRITRSRRR